MRSLIKILCFVFWAMQSFGQAVDTTSGEKKARYKIGLLRNRPILNIPNNSLSGSMSAIADMAAYRVPFMSMKDLRLGKADTAKIVQVINPVNGKVFTYYYDSANTTSLDDSATILRNGNRRFILNEDQITPEIFGAKGDGVSNDSLAFAKAIRYLNAKGGGTLNIPAKTYNKAYIFITKKDVNVVGRGTIKNATIFINSGAPGTIFNFTIDGVTMYRDDVPVSENSDKNNGIELQNVGMGRISNVRFTNQNAGIYVRPTGVFQQTKRIEVNNCRTEYGNYSIKIAETPDSLNGLPVASKRSIGDFTITNCVFQWPNFDQIYMSGVDGVVMSNITCFSSPFDNRNRATKRNNIYLDRATYVTMTNMNLFEAGLDGIRCNNCDNIRGSNFHIAWPGQRVASSGIHFTRTTTPTYIDVAISFSNVLIDNPTLHSVYIEGPTLTRMYSFSQIQTKYIGEANRYYGFDPPYNNPSLGTYPHNTIYTDIGASGVVFDGSLNSEWITREAYFLGTGSIAREYNVRRLNTKVTLSSDMIIDSDESVVSPIVENLLLNSNSLSTSGRFSTINGSVTLLSSQPSPFGTGTIFKFIEDNAGSTQKSISNNVNISKPATDLPFTVSLYVKAAERRFICLYVTSSTFSNGLKIDYDALTGSTGALIRSDEGYKLISSKIKKANNGFFRIELSFISPSSATSVRAAVYLKDKIENPGNQSYVGDGVSGIYMSDWQISQTSSAISYVPTFGSIVAQQNISNFRPSSSSIDSSLPVSGTYNQIEVQAILNELRDLKVKMRVSGLLSN